jgi:hypothetical protein
MILERYRDVPVFGTLEADCVEIMKEVAKRSRAKMMNAKVNPQFVLST